MSYNDQNKDKDNRPGQGQNPQDQKNRPMQPGSGNPNKDRSSTGSNKGTEDKKW